MVNRVHMHKGAEATVVKKKELLTATAIRA